MALIWFLIENKKGKGVYDETCLLYSGVYA